MAPRNPEIEDLSRALDALAQGGTGALEIEQAREVLRAAGDVLSGSYGGKGDTDAARALTLARLALERARAAQGGPTPRRSWQQALGVKPAPVPRSDADERRESLELDSEIPDDHPAKSAIESSVVGALAGVKGRWRVAILVQPEVPWWGIRVEGASICWTGTLEGADEQSPEFVVDRVREAVRLGQMQAALPRPRGRA